jgi:hypothetical protein
VTSPEELLPTPQKGYQSRVEDGICGQIIPAYGMSEGLVDQVASNGASQP